MHKPSSKGKSISHESFIVPGGNLGDSSQRLVSYVLCTVQNRNSLRAV